MKSLGPPKSAAPELLHKNFSNVQTYDRHLESLIYRKANLHKLTLLNVVMVASVCRRRPEAALTAICQLSRSYTKVKIIIQL